MIQPSARSAAGRINGKLGGLKTAATHSKDFLEDRARKAGSSTRDTYGIDYYRHLRKTRKPHKINPLANLNNNKQPRTQLSSVQLMREVTKNLIN